MLMSNHLTGICYSCYDIHTNGGSALNDKTDLAALTSIPAGTLLLTYLTVLLLICQYDGRRG